MYINKCIWYSSARSLRAQRVGPTIIPLKGWEAQYSHQPIWDIYTQMFPDWLCAEQELWLWRGSQVENGKTLEEALVQDVASLKLRLHESMPCSCG